MSLSKFWVSFVILYKIMEFEEESKYIMARKNNANIGFEKQIWDAACVLWGHIPAAEYRKVIKIFRCEIYIRAYESYHFG